MPEIEQIRVCLNLRTVVEPKDSMEVIRNHPEFLPSAIFTAREKYVASRQEAVDALTRHLCGDDYVIVQVAEEDRELFEEVL